MENTSFTLNLLGLCLQTLGIIIGGLGVVGERFLDYRPMQALASVQFSFTPVYLARIPILHAITQTLELKRGKDDRYNKWEVMTGLFVALLLGLPFVASVYLIPIVYVYRFYIPLIALLIWVVISIVVVVFPAISLAIIKAGRPPAERVFQPIPKVPLTIHIHILRVDLQKYIRSQLRYFFITPLELALMLMILLSQILLNWFAWVIRLNLADKELRGRYYALYSLFALFLGTIFLIVALLQGI